MSLINRVLSDLDKRGEQTDFEAWPVRAVPQRSLRQKIIYLIVFIVIILSCLAAVLSWRSRVLPPAPSASPAVREVAVVSAPVVAPLPVASGVASAVMPDAVMASAPSSAVAMAARLSFELSSIPLPNRLRAPLLSAHKPALPLSKPTEGGPVSAVAAVPITPSSSIQAVPAASGVHPVVVKSESAQQRAENEFRQAYEWSQRGVLQEAFAGYERALQLDPKHALARQSLVALLLNAHRPAEAENLLQAGLQINPTQTQFAMLLARLQVERKAVPLALETLQTTLPHAEQLPDYQAFFAALLQQQNRHAEAVVHYQVALQLAPQNGLWWMGLGLSLQALLRRDQAAQAFEQALRSHTLGGELETFVLQKLKALKRE